MRSRALWTLLTSVLVLSLTWDAQAQGRKPDLEPLVPGSELPKEDKPPERAVDTGSGWDSDSDVEHLLGLRFGINYSVLDRPGDQPGDPTLLSGSAFTGPGFVVGPTYEIIGLLPYVGFETGLIYTRSTATGFEAQGELKREILLEVASARVPLWAKFRLRVIDALTVTAGLGLDALIGFSSASTVREQNVPQDEIVNLETSSVTALHLGGQVGVEFDFGSIHVPITLHGSFNPSTGATTTDRYESYGGAEEPGPYKLEFDFELVVLLGVAYVL